MARNGCYQINSAKIIHDTIDGEVILVNVESGNYYQLPQVGAEIWACIERGMDLSEIIDHLSSLYQANDHEIETSIYRLAEQLLDEELLVPLATDQAAGAVATAVAPPGCDSRAPKAAYVTPVLCKYTDLQGLLLLDPVHEVDEQGWPAIKTRENSS